MNPYQTPSYNHHHPPPPGRHQYPPPGVGMPPGPMFPPPPHLFPNYPPPPHGMMAPPPGIFPGFPPHGMPNPGAMMMMPPMMPNPGPVMQKQPSLVKPQMMQQSPMKAVPPAVPPTVPTANSSADTTTTATSAAAAVITPTAYVGKIPETVEDEFIRKLLELCGKVVKWNRASDTSGKLKGFGFCEFDSPEGVLRALRLLHDIQVDDKNLMVKVEDKVQKYLNEYIENRNNDSEKDKETQQSEEKDQDEKTKLLIQQLIQENKDQLEEKKKKKDKQIPQPDYQENKFIELRLMTKDEKLKMAAKEKEREIEKEKERETRKKERNERALRDREKDWEARELRSEKDREREKERERERERNEIYVRRQEMEEYSSDDEHMRKRLRTRDAIKRRQKELEEDIREKEREREREKEASGDAVGSAGISVGIKRSNNGFGLTEEAINKIQLDFSAKRAATRLNIATGFNTHEAEEPEQIVNKKQMILLDYNEIFNTNSSDVDAKVLLKSNVQQQNNNNNQQPLRQSQQAAVGQQPQQKVKQRSKEELQKIIETIPNDKDDLLKMKMEWDDIERLQLIETKLKPWVNKKLTEIIGAEETILIEHIVSLMKQRSDPHTIILQLKEMIDEEAENFVLKMWRMLAFLVKTSD